MTKLQHSAATAGFIVLAVFMAVPARPHVSRPETTEASVPYGGAAALMVGLFGLAARRRL